MVVPRGGEIMNHQENIQHAEYSGDCASCPLQRTGACGSVAALMSAPGGGAFDCHVFKPGAVLYRSGEPADGLHFIVSGGVKLVRGDPAGNERIVRIAQDGGVLGFDAMTGGVCQHTAIAFDEVRTCRIPADELPRVLARRPILQLHLLRHLQAALSEADAWTSDLVSGVVPARVRLARLLLRLRFGDGNRIRRLQLTEVGSILGQTPETVCRTLKVFEQDGALVPQGARGAQRHYLADIDALQRIAYEGADTPLSSAATRASDDVVVEPSLQRSVRSRRGEAGLLKRAPVAAARSAETGRRVASRVE